MQKTIYSSILVAILLFSISLAFAASEKSLCRTSCNIEFKSTVLSCNEIKNSCFDSCESESNSCLAQVESNYLSCTSVCSNDQTCLKSCRVERQVDKIECKKDMTLCKKDCSEERRECIKSASDEKRVCSDKCILGNFAISEDQCISNGGLYQQLCNGPYFDIKCSADDFCQCGGVNNYTCPHDYQCQKSFRISGIPKTSVIGWKDYLGKNLGDIGLCEKI